MAALLKGQILKVLSRFARDIDPNQLKFSSLSQAFLSDLVLNEEVLSNVLELPIWIKLSRAVCNRVSIQIPWTHLSSQPIRISLDEVYVDMETCSQLRPFSETPVTTIGDYGRTEMAVDGMLVTVNTVEITFRAPSFHASIQINRIKVYSTTPDYEPSQDLRMTRLKDESRDAILVFKCVSWQTVRIEASSGRGNNDGPNRSSIRLITSAGQARIALKKHLSNCELMASRLQLIMDDLLWVLTPSQLKAALLVCQELQALASTADAVIRTKKAAKKLKSSQGSSNRPKRSASNSASAKITQYFDRIDITETSYHFHLGKLNLHICDEPRVQAVPAKYEDAAILIEVERLKLDYYPYHIPSTTRKHWLHYREPDPHFIGWQTEIMGDYRRQLDHTHPDLRANPLQYLMCAILVFQVDDFRLNNMTTIHSQKTKNSKLEGDYPLCCSLKKTLHLPKNCAAAHLEYIVSYYPIGVPFNAPPHIMQLFCNPVQLTLDPPTLDWFSLVCADMCAMKDDRALSFDFSDTAIPEVVCRFEMLLPKTICPVELPESSMRDHALHYGLQIQSGRAIVTNTQTGRGRTLADSLISTGLQHNPLLHPHNTFPSQPDDPDLASMAEKLAHLSTIAPTASLATSLWSLVADPLWIEFVDLRQEKRRPLAFLEPFPLTVWGVTFEDTQRMIFGLVDAPVPAVKVQLTNDGYNVLLRATDTCLKVFETVMLNCKDIFEAVKEQSDVSVLVAAVASIRKVECTLVIDSSTETSDSLSTDRMSESSQQTPSAETGLKSAADIPLNSSASLRDDFPVEFVPRDLDADSVSMRSVMSESSLAEMNSAMVEDLSGIISAGGMDISTIEQAIEPPTVTWTSRSPDLSDKNTVRILTAELFEIDTVIVALNETLFTKLTCGSLHLKLPSDPMLNGTSNQHDISNQSPMVHSGDPKIALRCQSDEIPDGTAQALLTVLCHNCALTCPAEAASRMGSFFKTDLVGQPMPLLLTLRDFKIAVEEGSDRLVSSGVRVQDLTVTRGKDGLFAVDYEDQCGCTRSQSSSRSVLPTASSHERIMFLKQKQSLIAQELQSLQAAQLRNGG